MALGGKNIGRVFPPCYARFTNPLYDVKIQTGASVTFWVKTAENNLSGAILSFANEDNSIKTFFTPNAWLKFDSPSASLDINNPTSTVTNALTPNEWHYVALIMRTDGYTIYIDGEQAFEDTVEAEHNYTTHNW